MKQFKQFFVLILMTLFSVSVWGATEYEYQMISSVGDITAGTYVVGALRSSTATNNFYFAKASVSSGDWVVSDDAVTIAEVAGVRKFDATSLPTGAVEFELTGNNTDGFTIKNGTNYLYYTAASNRKLAFATSGSTFKWTFSAKSSPLITGGVVIKKKTGLDGNYTISENSTGTGAIRGYANTTEYRAIYLFKKQEKSSGGSSVTVPTFTPNGGSFVGSQSVTLAQADSKEIYYTTNGDDPTTAGTLYSAPFTLTETTTVKAAAKDGSNWSDVVSKTFTKLDLLTTMQAIFDKATAVAGTPTEVAVTFDNWVVTGVKNSNAYVTDGTKGFIVYTSSHGFAVGNILSGTAVCKVQLYNGSAELTELTAAKVTVTTGGTAPVNVLDASGIAALTGANTGSVIKISGECTKADSKYYIGGVQLYNSLYSFSVSEGTSYDCTGVYVLYNSTKEILPRSAADIVVNSGVSVTDIDLTESTASVEAGETVTLHASVIPANATNKTIVWSVQSGDTYASVNANGVVTGITAGEAVVRAASEEDASIYEECTVTVTAADPTVHHVTFDATVDQGESPLTKDNITFTCSNGVLNNGNEYRLYKNSINTFECSVGNITKIEFTGVSGNPVSGFAAPAEGDFETEGNDGVWTGNEESISFTASGAQVRTTLIKVTYKEDNRSAADLAWDPAADIEITVGDAFTAPTLLNPNSIDAAEITIESSNPSLATITAGVVSLVTDATGTATITATFAGNASYKPATVSYNITVNEPGMASVTFDSSVDHAASGETTITKGGFTLSFTSGSMDGTQAEYRLYKGQTMTLSSTDYFIKKIEFTCTAGNPIGGFADAAGLDKDNNQWTGETNTVELIASGAQVRITQLVVYYVEDTRAATRLAYNPAVEEYEAGTWTQPELQNPNGLTGLSYESDAPTIAAVDGEGNITLEGGFGTATITATFAGNATYKSGTATYTITVIDPTPTITTTPTSLNWGTVIKEADAGTKTITVTLHNVAAATATLGGTNPTAYSIDKTDIANGDVITVSVVSTAAEGSFPAKLIITDNAGLAANKEINLSLRIEGAETPVSTSSKWVAATEITDGMKVLVTGVKDEVTYAMGAQTSNNRAAVAGALAAGIFTPGENTMAFTVAAQEGGTYALQASNGKYLYAASSSNNYLRSQDDLDDNGKWTLAIASAEANGTNTHNVMQFNGSSTLFSCYESANQSPIALYVRTKVPGTVAVADLAVVAGESKAIAYTTNNTDEPGVTYEILSGSENVVAYNGLITGVKAGNATIRMTLAETENYTSASDEFTVTVSTPSDPAKAIEKIGGKFIINAHGDTAVFSRGNLKYNVATEQWYCANKQYDFVGENGNLHFGDANYKGEFDLFGWSCGSSNYGLLASNHDEAFTGDFIDWGGLFTSGEDEWSSLSKDEMNYIIAHHKWTTLVLDPTPADADNEDEIYGLALFPYDWVMPAGFEGLHYSLCDWNEETKFADNTIDLAAWPTLEDAGAVFLPMAGARAGHWGNNWNGSAVDSRKNPNPNGGNSYCWVDNIGWYGYYWLSTPHATNNKLADYLIFPGWSEGPTTADDDDLYLPPVVWSREKRRGNSVRLVTRKPRVPDYVRTDMIGNGVLGTVCVDHNVAINDAYGATFYELVGKNAEGKMAFEQITSGELEAGVPYLFQSNGEDLVLYYGNTKVDNPVDAGNGMHGTFSQVVLSGSDLNDVYYFANHALWSCADLIANSQPLTIPANRAYLVMSEVGDASPSPAPGRIRMTLNVNGAPAVVTGMEEITNDQSQMTDKVIIDGHLYILRGEKMYDATGRMVK